MRHVAYRNLAICVACMYRSLSCTDIGYIVAP